ncbi:RNA ligase family protein [Gluconobacter cerinus]
MFPIRKFASIPHLQGSAVQDGDSRVMVPLSHLMGRLVVIEEKLDGGNSGICFDEDCVLHLQSRGHFLEVGNRSNWRERHYNPMKDWATAFADDLYYVLTDRFILYGEWLYASHAVFYDRLPGYFVVFDIYDRHEGRSLGRQAREDICHRLGLPMAPRIWSGLFDGRLQSLQALFTRPAWQSASWKDNLAYACSLTGRPAQADVADVLGEKDGSGLIEGVCVSIEDGSGHLSERYKFVRQGFLQVRLDAGAPDGGATGNGSGLLSSAQWHQKPIIPNLLATPVIPLPSHVVAPDMRS